MINNVCVGLYESDITPKDNVWLVGYANRFHKSRGVYKKIKAGAIYLKINKKEYLIITADLIGFSPSFTASLKTELGIILGINYKNIILTATHTHCGPYFWKWNMPGFVEYEYSKFLLNKIIKMSMIAKSSGVTGKLYYSKTKSNFGVNRRKIIDGKAEFKPNPNGPMDRDLYTVIFKDIEDSIIGTWTIYGCHPTSLGGYLIGPDYPGYVKDRIRKYTHSYAFFSTGCAGDIRPLYKKSDINTDTTKGHQGIGTFNRPTFKELEIESKKIASDVINNLDNHNEIKLNNFKMQQFFNYLDFNKLPSKKDLLNVMNGGNDFINVSNNSKYYKKWAKYFLNQIELTQLPETCPQEIQIMCFDNLNIIFLAGEILTEIGINIKKEFKNKETITIAYSNGLIGYVAGSSTYKYGGYELDKSYPLYLKPSKFSINSEDKIIDNLNKFI